MFIKYLFFSLISDINTCIFITIFKKSIIWFILIEWVPIVLRFYGAWNRVKSNQILLDCDLISQLELEYNNIVFYQHGNNIMPSRFIIIQF